LGPERVPLLNSIKTHTMAKKIKHRLILHGVRREIDMGVFESKAAAKSWAKNCWDRPFTIKPVK